MKSSLLSKDYVAGIFLTFSVLFAGSKVYASEICFLVFLLLSYSFKYRLYTGLISILFITLCFLSSFQLNRNLNELIFIVLILALPAFCINKDKVNLIYIVKGIAFALSLSAAFGFFLLIIQIFLPSISGFFQPCFYGMQRSVGMCGIPPYIIDGFPLQRLYGLASEPSTYGMTHVLFLTFLISIPDNKLPASFYTIQIASILATISIIAITLLSFICLVSLLYKQQRNSFLNKITVSNIFKFIIFIILGFIILLIFGDGLTDAIFKRFFGRFYDFFNGVDTSGFMRINNTWGPVGAYLGTESFYKVAFGLGVTEYLKYLNNYVTLIKIDETLIKVTGQRGSIMSTIIMSYGLVTSVGIFVLLVLNDRLRVSLIFICTLGFLFFHTNALSFSTLSLIFVVNLQQNLLLSKKVLNT